MQLVVPLTSKCNFSCPFCYVDVESAALHKADMSRLFPIVEQLARREEIDVVLSGGEPTLVENLGEIIAGMSFAGARVSIATNGSRPAVVRRLNVSGVQVSIDGPRELHDNIRRAWGAFDRALATIEHCNENDIPVSIQTTFSTLNIDAIDESLDMLCNLPVRQVRLIAVHSGSYALGANSKQLLFHAMSRWLFRQPEAPSITSNLCLTGFAREILRSLHSDSLPWFFDQADNVFRLGSPNGSEYKLSARDFLNEQSRYGVAQSALKTQIRKADASADTFTFFDDFSNGFQEGGE